MRLPRLCGLVRAVPLSVGCWLALSWSGIIQAEEAGESEVASARPEVMTVGHPQAPGMMVLVKREIESMLNSRGVESEFYQWRGYVNGILANTAGPRIVSELTGNCRLEWFNQLMKDPVHAPVEAELFTRQLHGGALGDHRGLASVLMLARDRLDLPPRPISAWPEPTTPAEAMATVERAMVDAQVDFAAALAPLTKSELAELEKGLYPVFTSQNTVGHTLQSRMNGRHLMDIMEKMDRDGLHAAAESLVALVDPSLLNQIGSMDAGTTATVPGATGSVVGRIGTAAGDIVVGGRGTNSYKLDEMRGVSAVVDLGGDDTYYDGTVRPGRPLLVVIDLEGHDTYRGSRPGIQGGSILGVSMLVDVAGNDVYEGQDNCQGSALAGVGILIDGAGNDVYQALRRTQGQAITGVGLLIDRGGHDRYRAALWGQGMGGPLGFGMIDDLAGQDQYYLGGTYFDSYEETPGYDGWGQGVGAGLRQVSSGGIGVCLDGGGDDRYEFDYLAHGGGYWAGCGFFRDFGGNDQHLGGTLTMYDGRPRVERRFQRFGNGWGCHYAIGFLYDDGGDDVYQGTIMSTGFAWDASAAYLCDLGGSDRYEATGGGVQGNGAQAGLGTIFEFDGDDIYRGSGQGRASSNISYHPMPQCGGNFSFVIDYGGKDQYGCGARNDAVTQRGKAGFVIDRPKQAPKTEQTAGPAR